LARQLSRPYSGRNRGIGCRGRPDCSTSSSVVVVVVVVIMVMRGDMDGDGMILFFYFSKNDGAKK
jgi:hypothetical protein